MVLKMNTLKSLIEKKSTVTIGNSKDNDWTVDRADISPKHCQISKTGMDQYIIVDLGSENGTFLNNEKVSYSVLTENDFIKIGNYIFQLTSEVETKVVSDPPISSLRAEHVKESLEIEDKPKALSSTNRILVYCLYAQEDENAAVFLDKHLAALRLNQNTPIVVEGPFQRKAGEELSKDEGLLLQANIILVFISADLISNSNTYQKTQIAINNHNTGKSLVIPILTRRCMWQETPFSKLGLLPKNKEPLYCKKSWGSEDESFSMVVAEIKNAINVYYHKEKEYEEKGHVEPIPVMEKLKVDFKSRYDWNIFWKRGLAYIIDVLIFVFLSYFLIFSFELDIDIEYDPVGFYTIMVLMMFTVSTYMESGKFMASPGKLILGLVITNINGEKLTSSEAFKRNLVKFSFVIFIILDTVFALIYYVAQIGYFYMKKEFFQDIITKTTLSPKIKVIRATNLNPKAAAPQL